MLPLPQAPRLDKKLSKEVSLRVFLRSRPTALCRRSPALARGSLSFGGPSLSYVHRHNGKPCGCNGLTNKLRPRRPPLLGLFGWCRDKPFWGGHRAPLHKTRLVDAVKASVCIGQPGKPTVRRHTERRRRTLTRIAFCRQYYHTTLARLCVPVQHLSRYLVGLNHVTHPLDCILHSLDNPWGRLQKSCRCSLPTLQLCQVRLWWRVGWEVVGEPPRGRFTTVSASVPFGVLDAQRGEHAGKPPVVARTLAQPAGARVQYLSHSHHCRSLFLLSTSPYPLRGALEGEARLRLRPCPHRSGRLSLGWPPAGWRNG
eukprot:Hpha_TRINITY_DN27533_c0_g1::TRINITY_DN27533_c0_g1_i1::g.86177::m.86177